jgi:hypothetical protein
MNKLKVKIIARFIDELIEAYPIDANHISLIALASAILSYAVALLSRKGSESSSNEWLFESRNHSRRLR